MSRSILTVDVGNTSTTFARYDGAKHSLPFRVATPAAAGFAGLAQVRRKFGGKPPEAIVIASVVPSAGKKLKVALSRDLGAPALLIGSDLHVPMVNRYKRPKQVGADRLVNALAAWRRYRRDTIVVDFGTAITFDVVSRKGEYLGGVIAPGIEISLDALYSRTALLPKTRLKAVSGILGRDTVNSIRSGCCYGIGGLCDRILDEIDRQRKVRSAVVATGGYARFMAQYCRRVRKIDPYLTLDGIFLTYLEHVRFQDFFGA